MQVLSPVWGPMAGDGANNFSLSLPLPPHQCFKKNSQPLGGKLMTLGIFHPRKGNDILPCLLLFPALSADMG